MSLAVAIHAFAPTVVVRGDHPAVPGPDHPVVVGTDGSASASGALDVAADLAAEADAPLQIVSAWTRPPTYGWRSVYAHHDLSEIARATATQALRRAIDRVTARSPGLAVTGILREGPAAEALTDVAEGTAILVVGTRGHGALTSLLVGSVSSAAVRYARCPVVIVQRGQAPRADESSQLLDAEV